VEIVLNGSESDGVDAATRLFRAHPGQAAVLVTAEEHDESGRSGGSVQLRLRSRSLQVQPCDLLLTGLRDVFGSDHVRLVKA
jgi:hypothetical protein